MTNFNNPKPYIATSSELPVKRSVDKVAAIREAVEIIRENKKVVEAAKSANDYPHR